jgi:SRSO17 transposase
MSQPLVLPEIVASILMSFAPVFTKPSFEAFRHYVGALMLGEGRRTGAAIARSTAEAKSQGVYARLCSRARWSAAALLDQLWALLLQVLPWPRDREGRLILWTAIDDSVVPKTGKRIAGLAYHFHHNAGKDERAWPFLFGHCWVTLGLVWPTVTRALCFPLRAALYLRAKDCTPAGFRKKTSLALDLLGAVSWPAQVCLHVLADGAYATRDFLRGVRARGHHALTRLKCNADLRWPASPKQPGQRGRPRLYGGKVDLAHYHDSHRQEAPVRIGAQHYLATYSALDAVPRRFGQLSRIVIVDLPRHQRAVLLSTDISLSPIEIVERYAMRFAIEIAYRELKQRFGWGHYQVRSREAIERHVTLSFVACSLTTLLLAQRDDQQTVGEIRRALQGAALLAWLFRVMGKTALQRKNALLAQLRHPLLQGMAGV